MRTTTKKKLNNQIMRGCDGDGDGDGDGNDHDDDDDDDDDGSGDGDGGGVGDSDCGATDNNQLNTETDTSSLTPRCSAAKTTRKPPRPANRAQRRIVRRDKRTGWTSSITVRGRRRRERSRMRINSSRLSIR